MDRRPPWLTGPGPMPIGAFGGPAGNPQTPPNLPNRLRVGRALARPSTDTGPIAPIFDESQWQKFNGEQVWNLANDTSTLVLDSPSQLRNGLVLRNASDTTTGPDIYISMGGPASLRSIYVLAPGDILNLDQRIPQDQIYAFADSTGAGSAGILIVAASQTPGVPI